MEFLDLAYQFVLDFFGNHSVPSHLGVDAFVPILFYITVIFILMFMFKIAVAVVGMVVTMGGRI